MDTLKLVRVRTLFHHGAHARVWYSPRCEDYSYDVFDPNSTWIESVLGYHTLDSALVAARHALERVVVS
jgi:hypothetical protein